MQDIARYIGFKDIQINIFNIQDTVNGFLPWLKTIRGSQGSEASNDMERIGRILRDSEIKIGDKSQQILQHGNMLVMFSKP